MASTISLCDTLPPNLKLLCRTIRVGSLKILPYDISLTIPVFVNTQSFMFRVPTISKGKNSSSIITLTIRKETLTKVMGFFSRNLFLLFIHTTTEEALSIKKQLGASEDDKDFYDPNSSDETQKRITLILDYAGSVKNYPAVKDFLHLKFPGTSLLSEINHIVANKILVQSTPKHATIIFMDADQLKEADVFSFEEKEKQKDADATDILNEAGDFSVPEENGPIVDNATSEENNQLPLLINVRSITNEELMETSSIGSDVAENDDFVISKEHSEDSNLESHSESIVNDNLPTTTQTHYNASPTMEEDPDNPPPMSEDCDNPPLMTVECSDPSPMTPEGLDEFFSVPKVMSVYCRAIIIGSFEVRPRNFFSCLFVVMSKECFFFQVPKIEKESESTSITLRDCDLVSVSGHFSCDLHFVSILITSTCAERIRRSLGMEGQSKYNIDPSSPDNLEQYLTFVFDNVDNLLSREIAYYLENVFPCQKFAKINDSKIAKDLLERSTPNILPFKVSLGPASAENEDDDSDIMIIDEESMEQIEQVMDELVNSDLNEDVNPLDEALLKSSIQMSCRVIRIGTYEAEPFEGNDISVFLSPESFVFRAPKVSKHTELVYIQLKKKDLSEVLFQLRTYGPIISIITSSPAAETIRSRLGMIKGNLLYFDPCSDDERHRRIVFILTEDRRIRPYDSIRKHMCQVFPGRQHIREIDKDVANDILIRSTPSDDIYNKFSQIPPADSALKKSKLATKIVPKEENSSKNKNSKKFIKLFCRSIKIGSHEFKSNVNASKLFVCLNNESFSFRVPFIYDDKADIPIVVNMKDILHTFAHFGCCIPLISLQVSDFCANGIVAEITKVKNNKASNFDPFNKGETKVITFTIECSESMKPCKQVEHFWKKGDFKHIKNPDKKAFQNCANIFESLPETIQIERASPVITENDMTDQEKWILSELESAYHFHLNKKFWYMERKLLIELLKRYYIKGCSNSQMEIEIRKRIEVPSVDIHNKERNLPWIREENLLLHDAQNKLHSRWLDIMSLMLGRTVKSLKRIWNKISQNTFKSDEDDKIVKELLNKYGLDVLKWKPMVEEMKLQVRKQFLSSGREPWTTAEMQSLIKIYRNTTSEDEREKIIKESFPKRSQEDLGACNMILKKCKLMSDSNSVKDLISYSDCNKSIITNKSPWQCQAQTFTSPAAPIISEKEKAKDWVFEELSNKFEEELQKRYWYLECRLLVDYCSQVCNGNKALRWKSLQAEIISRISLFTIKEKSSSSEKPWTLQEEFLIHQAQKTVGSMWFLVLDILFWRTQADMVEHWNKHVRSLTEEDFKVPSLEMDELIVRDLRQKFSDLIASEWNVMIKILKDKVALQYSQDDYRPWNILEVRLMVDAYDKFGEQWDKIAELLFKRSSAAVKNCKEVLNSAKSRFQNDEESSSDNDIFYSIFYNDVNMFQSKSSEKEGSKNWIYDELLKDLKAKVQQKYWFLECLLLTYFIKNFQEKNKSCTWMEINLLIMRLINTHEIRRKYYISTRPFTLEEEFIIFNVHQKIKGQHWIYVAEKLLLGRYSSGIEKHWTDRVNFMKECDFDSLYNASDTLFLSDVIAECNYKSNWSQVTREIQKHVKAHFLESDYKPWTLKEVSIMVDAYRKFGNKWDEIAVFLPGRTADNIESCEALLCSISDDASDISQKSVDEDNTGGMEGESSDDEEKQEEKENSNEEIAVTEKENVVPVEDNMEFVDNESDNKTEENESSSRRENLIQQFINTKKCPLCNPTDDMCDISMADLIVIHKKTCIPDANEIEEPKEECAAENKISVNKENLVSEPTITTTSQTQHSIVLNNPIVSNEPTFIPSQPQNTILLRTPMLTNQSTHVMSQPQHSMLLSAPTLTTSQSQNPILFNTSMLTNQPVFAMPQSQHSIIISNPMLSEMLDTIKNVEGSSSAHSPPKADNVPLNCPTTDSSLMSQSTGKLKPPEHLLRHIPGQNYRKTQQPLVRFPSKTFSQKPDKKQLLLPKIPQSPKLQNSSITFFVPVSLSSVTTNNEKSGSCNAENSGIIPSIESVFSVNGPDNSLSGNETSSDSSNNRILKNHINNQFFDICKKIKREKDDSESDDFLKSLNHVEEFSELASLLNDAEYEEEEEESSSKKRKTTISSPLKIKHIKSEKPSDESPSEPFLCEIAVERKPKEDNQTIASSLSPNIRNIWTEEEDGKLTHLIENQKMTNWDDIAKQFSNRSSIQCYRRWWKIRVSLNKNRKWKEEEDKELTDLVLKYGSGNWQRIAKFFPRWRAKDCRRRWQNYLNPAANRPWTQDEDNVILAGYDTWGGRWSKIKKLLVGRTVSAIKQHYLLAIEPNVNKQQQLAPTELETFELDKILELEKCLKEQLANGTALEPIVILEKLDMDSLKPTIKIRRKWSDLNFNSSTPETSNILLKFKGDEEQSCENKEQYLPLTENVASTVTKSEVNEDQNSESNNESVGDALPGDDIVFVKALYHRNLTGCNKRKKSQVQSPQDDSISVKEGVFYPNEIIQVDNSVKEEIKNGKGPKLKISVDELDKEVVNKLKSRYHSSALYENISNSMSLKDFNVKKKENVSWHPEEEEELLQLVNKLGFRWNDISESFPGRNKYHCLNKWTALCEREREWSKEEDEKIIEAASKNVSWKWPNVARQIHRTPNICKDRWKNHLMPITVKDPVWSLEEENIVLKEVKESGLVWSKIAELIPGRSEVAIMNMWYTKLCKKSISPENADVVMVEES